MSVILSERKLCRRCLKCEKTCYCARIRPTRVPVQFVILQHPREYRNAIGTARIVQLCIVDSKVIIGAEFDQNEEVNSLIANPENYCVVLFPGPHSYHLNISNSEQFQSALPKNKKMVIFVMDGTWDCAKKMLYRSKGLSLLPQICFTPGKKSEYKIRQQPSPHCLSTIEAVHRILGILDPSLDCDNLMEVFRGMVEQQLRFFNSNKNI